MPGPCGPDILGGMDPRTPRRPSLPIPVLLLFVTAVWAAALASLRKPRPPGCEPITLRVKWETVQVGMTVEQARKRLGPPGGPEYLWVVKPTDAEQRVLEDGRTVRYEWPPPWKLNWIDPGTTRTDPRTGRRYERWGEPGRVACVVYGPDGRVDEKGLARRAPLARRLTACPRPAGRANCGRESQARHRRAGGLTQDAVLALALWPPDPYPRRVTFEQVRVGMTFEEVCAAVGVRGRAERQLPGVGQGPAAVRAGTA
jgi:hypothetical protein